METQYVASIISGIFTLLAAGFAILVFYMQQWAYKKNSAKTLFYDIVYAEKIIDDLKALKAQDEDKILNIDTNKYFLSTKSWENIKYLFINDLTTHEWERLNKFFNECESLNKTLIDIKSIFYAHFSPRTQTIQSLLGELSKEHADGIIAIDQNTEIDDSAKETEKESLKLNIETKADLIKSLYIDDPTYRYEYKPKGFYSFFNTNLMLVDTTLSTSSIGQKIKKLSK